ncbi:MAG TPA: alpha/beta hydrolase [Kofleriaceae bacterium]|nr:alpha/beta hydrolase [Kofleriaceae bacterium]
MRTLATVFLLALAAACGASSSPASSASASTASAPAAPSAPSARPTFEPTSFGVEIAGTGRPVILIPGLGCPASIWKETIAHLAASAQTHVLTLSGFAGRPPIDQPLVATARVELAAYIRDRHLDHPVLIGHSLGGFLAYWIAASEPDLVGPVVAVDAPPSIGAFPGAIEQGARMRDTWKKMSRDEFAKATREFFGTMANDPKQLEPLLTEILRSDQRTMADAFYELFSTDIRSDLPKIKAPVLAILADGPYQKYIGEQLAPVPHHVVVTIPHTKHIVMYDDPVGFFRALDTFLAGR